MVSVHPEGTLGRLRYPFGGDRPSQTPRQALSRGRIHCPRLGNQYCRGGIPTAAPGRLASPLHCLPPILYVQHRPPVPSWSKAPWGLSVLAQVTSILTGTSISPGALPRQCPNHYAFRAGRNLPDKEFRYLRTVIVTAAVYWGLSSVPRGSPRSHLPLTFQHRAGVSPYTSPSGFAQTCVFAKQLLGPILCGLVAQAPLLPKLRGHFAEFLGNASPAGLGVLPPSTCVGLRYGHGARNSGFSRHALTVLPYLCFGPPHAPPSRRGICLPPGTRACAGLSVPGLQPAHASPQFWYTMVQESPPVVHRLRVPASP